MRADLRDAFQQFSRNERWGTCVECPRDPDQHAYPEFCRWTARYDHQLSLNELIQSYQLTKS